MSLYKQQIRIGLFLFAFPLFVLTNGACSTALYLKAEMSIADIGLNKKSKSQSTDFGGKISTLHSIPNLGIGYDISDYFETEIMYGLQNHELKSYGYGADSEAFRVPNVLYTIARKEGYYSSASGKRIYLETACVNLEPTFITGKKLCSLCGDGTNTTLTAFALSISSRLHTLIPSVRIKPFKQVSIFTPYFSIGTGIAHSNSRYIYSSYKSSLFTQVYKGSKTTTGLALEAGIGTQLRLGKNVSLDFAAKYFDYGKHTMAPNISKKINGYKVTAGAILKFPTKNISPVIHEAQDNFAYPNKMPRVYDNSSMYNEAEKSFARKQGIEEGGRIATIAIAKKMLKLGMDKSNIVAITGLSIDDLNGICSIKPPASPQ